MRNLARTGLLVLVAWLGLSGMSWARQVYLRDGGRIECESYWKHNGRIVVKVNRDVMLEFAPGEIDLRKSFPLKKRGAAVKPKFKAEAEASTTASSPQAPGALAAAGREEARPVHPSAPAKEHAARPVPAQEAAAPVAPAAPAVRKEAQPEPVTAASPEPSPAERNEDFQRRTKENADLMADAVRKQDPALMKKAMEAQRELVKQQQEAQKAGQSGGAPGNQGNPVPKPEPPWFKYLLMMVFCGLLIVVSLWRVFAKAGESGWKALIPLYNVYILMQICGKPGWWFILLLIPVVGLAINLLAMLSLSEKFGRSPVFGVGLLLLPMIFFPLLAFGPSLYQHAVPGPDLNFAFSEEPPLS